MWEISLDSQLFGFGVALALGIVFSLIYDLLRACRRSFRPIAVRIFVEDIIYFFIMSIISFCFLLPLTNGCIRAYIIFGIALGFYFSRLTISVIWLKLLLFIIRTTCRIFRKINHPLNQLKRKIMAILRQIKKYIEEKIKKAKNSLKKVLKKQ